MGYIREDFRATQLSLSKILQGGQVQQGVAAGEGWANGSPMMGRC